MPALAWFRLERFRFKVEPVWFKPELVGCNGELFWFRLELPRCKVEPLQLKRELLLFISEQF
jgi:hypothetical protein